jgi:hypothetical protein
MRLFDDYDWAAVVGMVAVTLLGVLITHAWVLSFAVGALVGNLSAYALRRRASVPDRSLLGWMRARR